MPIESISIKNFKSIQDSGEISIRPVNVLIGANGVGKSNFISLFKMLNSISKKRLALYVADNGYENNILHFGRKKSKSLECQIVFKTEKQDESIRYDFKLSPKKHSTGFYFEEEKAGKTNPQDGTSGFWEFEDLGGTGKEESGIADNATEMALFLRQELEGLQVFHFHDTSPASALKQANKTRDYRHLKPDGSNLAAFLYKIKETHPKHFKIIEHTVRSVAPFFEKFDLAPDERNPEAIFLNWLEKGSDEFFDAHQLSDGSLRFIALATLLLQPDPPPTLLLDEPELGLHPAAVSKLAALVRKASARAQIIIATQSVSLINEFTADDLIVAERKQGQTVFSRLSEEKLKPWLEEYALGELWEKNVIGGRP